MSELKEGSLTRITTRIRALLPTDWTGRAGEHFRQTAKTISDYADKHGITEGATSGRELLGNKVEGMANKEYAESLKNFAETERIKIDAELQRRSLESKVRKEEAEAKLAELKVVDAEIELIKKLQEIGVSLQRDSNGNLTVLPLQASCDLTQLANRISAEVKQIPAGSRDTP